MSRFEFNISGLDGLHSKLKDSATLEDVKNAVKLNGSELEEGMKKEAVFTKGYSTGETRRNIYLDIEDDGFTAKVYPTTEYSPYLEFGTRFMTAQPFVSPAFNKQKVQFKKDMERLFK